LFTPEKKRKGLVIIGRDVTAFKQATEQVNKLAHYDALTELPNRRLMLGHLDQAIARSSIHGHTGAVLFIDLDHFKMLNDTAGHEIGDLLLKEVAARLKTCIHEEDMVARLGGDEFVIICQNLGHQKADAATNALMLGNRIMECFNVPFQLNQHSYHSSPSIGIALFSGHEFTVKELLKHADMAMYRAKAEGRNTVRFFDPHMQATLEGRNQIEEALHQVIGGKQFHLHYQVQVNGKRHATGAEALLRWDSPEMGWVPPRQFIPVAEESELIVVIGEWVLKTACAQLKSWETHDLTRSLKLAVNVSSRQFHQPQFVQQVENIVKNSGIDPTRLKLELTESTVLINIEDTIKKMQAIKSLGVCLSLDDFGTGYSSLLYLKELPLDQLKIDQSFLQNYF
jgi:diguanylate cyclase (GGDEF)-like protein